MKNILQNKKELKNLIFDKYQIRKSKKQKNAFEKLIKEYSAELGYKCESEKGLFGAKNIVVGDVENAKIIYTAHYDTCAVIPFPNFITPKNISIYILYNIFLAAAFFIIYFITSFASALIWNIITRIFSVEYLSAYLIFPLLIPYFLTLLLIFGPANKNTANDNTSGVMTLIELMRNMPEQERNKAAFVFFDLEEAGLLGSSGFAKKHKKIAKNTLLINFDCVSDGNNFIITLPKNAVSKATLFENAYSSEKYNVEVLTKGYFYPSDQANFKQGVGVAALKKIKRTNILYMDRIHTKKDTVYQEENIDFLVESSVKFTQML